MKIAYVSTDPGIPVFGNKGASIHVQEMSRAFLKAGAQVTLLSPRLEGTAPADLEAAKRIALPQFENKDRTAEARALQQLALNQTLQTALDEAGPFDLVYERHALFAHSAMEWAAARGIASILEVNAPLIEEQKDHRELALETEAVATTRTAMSKARHVIAVSPQVAAYCRAHGAKSPQTVPNGVNPDRFADEAKHDGPFTVGFLGTLKPWHDVDTLIGAFARIAGALPQSRLLIVGDGPERGRLEARLQELGLADRVCFTGAVDAAEVPVHLARMSVGIAAYRADQPFYFSPLKIYEYMAAGLPVIVTSTGNLESLIKGGRYGAAVPAENCIALAAELRDLAANPARARRMGQAAREHVFAAHSWDGIARNLLAQAGLSGRG